MHPTSIAGAVNDPAAAVVLLASDFRLLVGDVKGRRDPTFFPELFGGSVKRSLCSEKGMVIKSSSSHTFPTPTTLRG